MRILIVSSYLPFPLHDGGSVRLYNILKELSKRHKITLVCEIRSHQNSTDIEEIKKFCEEVFVVHHRRPWSSNHIAKAAFSTQPLLLTMHTFVDMKKHIVQVLADRRFDLIHVETFYVMQNLPKTYLPIVLVEHNIEYQVYAKFANKSNPLFRPLLFADIVKIKHWEERFWKQATKVVAVSEDECEQMKTIDAALVPNGVDIEKFRPKADQPMVDKTQKSKAKSKKEIKILFIGNFKWIQNQKAAQKILDHIWPKVIERLDQATAQNVKLWIVGKHIPDTIKAYQSKHIVIDEDAPSETEKIYQKSDILLAPLEVGGGSSYKILEAMASGVPVVTTPLGITGINAKEGVHALVGENDEEIAQKVVDLLQNEKISEKITNAARKFVEEQYNWQNITHALEKVYEDAIEQVK